MLDKLWIRIKGELLTLTQDQSTGSEVRARARELLERLTSSLRADPSGADNSVVEESAESNTGSKSAGSYGSGLAEIERELAQLRGRREERQAEAPPEEPPASNPRKLG